MQSSTYLQYEGRGSLAQSTYLQQLVLRGGEGLTCTIIRISPPTSYEGRGSFAQSTYLQVIRGLTAKSGKLKKKKTI